MRRRARLRSSLLDFVPRLTPEFQRPEHLAPLAAIVETALTEPVREAFTVPPRHGKSELLLHAVPFALQRDPTFSILYATHTATFAAKQSRRARRLCKVAGVEPEQGANRADEWQLPQGGGLVARGNGGEVTGRGFGLILVDDPLKGRDVAESATQREAIWEWLRADIFSRATPGGSIIVVHTRWHPDDPIGKLEGEGWPVTCLRAIAEPGDADREEGTALWPGGGWTVDVLTDRRREVGEYNWASLYQGRPRPRGGTVFGEPHYYDAAPGHGYRIGHGCDLAYTAKTSADYSVVVTVLAVGDLLYVVDVQRKQVDAPAFALTLRAAQAQYPGPMLWHCSGTEKGAAQFIQRQIQQFRVKQTTADKFVRAQAVAAAWNCGKVLLPRKAPWLDVFVAELCGFTGVGDVHDDQVDALASAHAVLSDAGKVSAYGSMQRLIGAAGGLPKRRM